MDFTPDLFTLLQAQMQDYITFGSDPNYSESEDEMMARFRKAGELFEGWTDDQFAALHRWTFAWAIHRVKDAQLPASFCAHSLLESLRQQTMLTEAAIMLGEVTEQCRNLH